MRWTPLLPLYDEERVRIWAFFAALRADLCSEHLFVTRSKKIVTGTSYHGPKPLQPEGYDGHNFVTGGTCVRTGFRGSAATANRHSAAEISDRRGSLRGL